MGFGVFYDALGQTGLGSRSPPMRFPAPTSALSGYWSPSESWTAALNTSVAPLYVTPGWDTLQLWFEGSLSDKGRYAALSEGSIPGAVVPVTATGLRIQPPRWRFGNASRDCGCCPEWRWALRAAVFWPPVRPFWRLRRASGGKWVRRWSCCRCGSAMGWNEPRCDPAPASFSTVPHLS